MRFIKSIPLFAYLWVLYNVLMVGGDMQETLAAGLFGVTLPSDAEWILSIADLFTLVGVVALYIEIFKSTRTGVSSILDHTLSMGVFILFLVEFIVVPGAGTSPFFILTMMSLLDVIAGYTISISAARRDFQIGPGE
ncbi:MAG: hypothetical protein ACREWG_07875 [Gammaproteobacteria bacterium]